MTSVAFSALFLVAVFVTSFIRIGLMRRQSVHVRRHRDAVPPAFADIISLHAHGKAADYTCARMRLGMAEAVFGAAVVLALTVGGSLQGLHTWLAEGFEAGSLAHGVALLAALAALSALLDLPFTLYRTFVIEKRHGFNRMTIGLFVADLARGAVLSAVIGLPVLAAVLWLMDSMGSLWWLWVWLFWIAFNLLALFVWPSFIAPLFNTFTPLADAALKARVEQLLARCGFQAQGLFVMDESRRSAHGNAYFTGFGAAKRIVFFDTLLEKLKPHEIEAVLAHELGHFHHGHIWKRLGVIAGLSLATLWLLAWLMQQGWFFSGLGMRSTDTAVALALLSLALPYFAFPLGPLMNHWSRAHEFEADRYAAHQTRADDLVGALVKLYRDNAATLTPDPLYSRFFDSHPPATLRIAQLHAVATIAARGGQSA